MRAPTELEHRLADDLRARAATVVDDPPPLRLAPRLRPPPSGRPPVAERVVVATITVAVLALVAGLLVVARPADEVPVPSPTTRPREFAITRYDDPLEGRRAPLDARPLRLGLDLPGAELVSAQNLVDPNDRSTDASSSETASNRPGSSFPSRTDS